MANIKTGFSYYSSDTDRFQDIRIKRLKKDLGCDGFAIYEYILNEIYRVKGCFLVWDESTAFDVADYWGLKETKVNEIVRYCCAVGLFDKTLLTNGNVLTSPSIQSRFVEMCIRAKRKEIIIPEEYNIIPEESRKVQEEYKIIQEEYKIIPEECRNQKKKENEKKSNTKEKINKKEKKESISKDIPKKDKKSPDIDYSAIADMFNSTLGDKLTRVIKITEKRKKAIKARINEFGLDSFQKVFDIVLDSEFLLGKNERNWMADFDWIVNSTHYASILEGKYNNRQNTITHGYIKLDAAKERERQTDEAFYQYAAEAFGKNTSNLI